MTDQLNDRAHKKGLVAITGATGFLGHKLYDHLTQAGYRVRAHSHTQEKVATLGKTNEPVVVGEIDDLNVMQQLVEGADYVIHTVSNFRVASGPADSYQRINVDGTKCIYQAAVAAGVKRFVHCSTIGVHGDVDSTPANEQSPYNPGDLYQSTKLESEQFVQSKVGTSPMEIVIMRPCSMYGPGDLRMLKMFKMLSKGRFFFVGKCLDNFHAVYIDDVADAFEKALSTKGINGEIFILGGPDSYRPLREYVGVVAKALGVAPPKLTFPYWLFHYAAVICERICVPLGIEPILHPRRVRFYKNNRAFDTSKSRDRLGLTPKVALDAGMKETVKWYREQGLLK